jgi:enoyl-CoA hydratase/carnithine racemase
VTLWAAHCQTTDGVARIVIRPVVEAIEEALANPDRDYVEIHTAMAIHLHACRFDPEVRVVVITGERPDEFYLVPSPEHYESQEGRDRLNLIKRRRGHGSQRGVGVPSAMETLALIDKPVVARVNGDAIGYGQSLLWGCDVIVAREDAVISDAHLGQGDVVDRHGEAAGFPWSVTPGDGAMGFLPAFLTPVQLKEYLLLSPALTAAEMARMGAINHAVSADRLDDVVDDVVARLLARPASVLARTKRAANKHLVEQWSRAQDLSTAYELLDFWEHARDGHLDAGWSPG